MPFKTDLIVRHARVCAISERLMSEFAQSYANFSMSKSYRKWLQCTLDLKHGGFGLRKVIAHTNASYIASVITNSSTIKDNICRPKESC